MHDKHNNGLNNLLYEQISPSNNGRIIFKIIFKWENKVRNEANQLDLNFLHVLCTDKDLVIEILVQDDGRNEVGKNAVNKQFLQHTQVAEIPLLAIQETPLLQLGLVFLQLDVSRLNHHELLHLEDREHQLDISWDLRVFFL